MSSPAHEIKIPVTTIFRFADTLRTYDCDVDTRKKCAGYIYTEGKRLEKLSYTLMDLLSLDGKGIQLQPTSTTSVVERLRQYYGAVSITDRFCFRCIFCTVCALGELLFSILRNLIDNTIRASDVAQEVPVKGELHGKSHRILVTDHRIGMQEENIQQASQPFYMMDKSRAQRQGGVGFGLSIVK